MGTGDFGNIVCPIFPMAAVAAFFDDFGVNGAFNFTDFKLDLVLGLHLVTFLFFPYAISAFACVWWRSTDFVFGFRIDFVGNGDHFHF